MIYRCRRTGRRIDQMMSPPTGCGSMELEVMARLMSRSAFNGYRWAPSAYSTVHCRSCGKVWRTRGNVANLPDAKDADGRHAGRTNATRT